MPSVCPTCNSDVDPAHAPVARVRGARVVAYCSTRCAQSDDTGAIAAPKEPEAAREPETTPTAKVTPTAKATPSTKARSPKADILLETPKECDAPLDTMEVAKTASRGLTGGRRRRVLWASAAIMVGGMAVAVVPAIAPTASRSVSAADSAPPPAAPLELPVTSATPPETKPRLSDAELRLQAISILEENLKGSSPRMQRMAGLALGRISHPGALKLLRERLESETSDLSRVDIAYGLALGGEEEGRDYLLGELKNKRRDVRVDAARRLVQLKDDAGRNTLVQMLGLKSHRLGAAAQLALLGDERGLEVLRQSFTDSASSAETKMRSAVGLGRAGDRSAVAFLKQILSEGRYVVDAAGALAALGESEAVPYLVKQLELTSIRVRAASSLARMRHKVDLQPLASALELGTPEGRIAAAEAILLLSAAQEQK